MPGDDPVDGVIPASRIVAQRLPLLIPASVAETHGANRSDGSVPARWVAGTGPAMTSLSARCQASRVVSVKFSKLVAGDAGMGGAEPP
jgi:hypothetical protein